MRSAEKAVREAAAALLAAFSEAKAASLHITWPRSPEGLGSLAISQCTRITNLDGSPLERDADGKLRGEPIKGLTAKQRAALPPLDPNAADDPADRVVRPAGKRKG